MPQENEPNPRENAARVSYCACALTLIALFVISLLDKDSQYNKKSEMSSENINDEEIAQNDALLVNGHLRNFTGYYKGIWEKRVINEEIPKLRFVTAEQGNVLMDLRLDKASESTLEIISGDVVLKNGLRITDEDVRMKIEGTYTPSIGLVYSVLKPKRPIYIPLSKAEIESGGRDYRKALRQEARKWASSRPPPLKFGLKASQQLELNKECDFFLKLHIRNKTNENLVDTEELKENLNIDGSIYSPNCDTTVTLSATAFHLEQYYSKAVHYTLSMAIITFIQIMLLLKQMERSSTPATALRVSMLSISQQAVIDAYLCLMHLTTGIVIEPLFNAFAMVSFFEFILFAIFEMRFMLIIWRAQRRQANDPWDTRRELSILYTRFYGSLMLGMILAFKFQRYIHWIIFVFYSFWIPQIIHCIRADVRQILKPSFIFGMTATRLFLPLYLYGCPENLIAQNISITFCIIITLYTLIQAFLLTLQYYYGPHCFVPRRFLPDKHNYFKPLSNEEISEILGGVNGDEETGNPEVVECVICMNPCEIRRPLSRMITPCEHIFHPQCLQRWMDVKMECPTCRQLLPPM